MCDDEKVLYNSYVFKSKTSFEIQKCVINFPPVKIMGEGHYLTFKKSICILFVYICVCVYGWGGGGVFCILFFYFLKAYSVWESGS